MTTLIQSRAGRVLHSFSTSLPLRDELLLTLLAAGAFLLFPDDVGLLTRVATTMLLTLSLWLILGLSGITSLGHAVFFGVGGYAAALFALHVSGDPLLGLALGGLAGAVLALLSGALLLRTHGLTFLMLTIAVAQLMYELANKARSITGGDDGLSAYAIEPLFGVFRFDMFGRTGYLYAVAVLVVSFFLIRRIAVSPFGLTCRGIRADSGRMALLGAPVYAHKLAVYTLGGLFAGCAGAVSAQVTGVVGLSGIEFTLSAEIMVMLILGGTRGPWGALVGTAAYMFAHHILSTANPFHWLIVMGCLLVAVVLFLPDGLSGLGPRVARLFRIGKSS